MVCSKAQIKSWKKGRKHASPVSSMAGYVPVVNVNSWASALRKIEEASMIDLSNYWWLFLFLLSLASSLQMQHFLPVPSTAYPLRRLCK